MPSEPIFICDDHCGRLARWLRFAGYDCLYKRDINDYALLRRAAADNRIILTRDSTIAERAMARTVVLVNSSAPLVQLSQVLVESGLSIERERIGTRCSVCNGLAEAVALNDIIDRVPPYVRQTKTSFRECTGCHRIYWHGTHVKNMIGELTATGLLEE